MPLRGDVAGRDVLLGTAHVGAGVVFWSLASILPRDVYWFSLHAMGLPSQVVYLSIVLGCPSVCLLSHTLRVYCAKGYGVGVSIGSLCLLSRHLDAASPETHLVTACVGLAAMLTVHLALWSSETNALSIDGSVTLPAMALHGLVLSNALLLWLRWAGLSLNPLLDLPGSGFSCIPLVALCGVLLYAYQHHLQLGKGTANATLWRRLLGLLGLASLLFFTQWLFTAPTAIPRWLGVHHAWGWLVLATYTLGIICAPLGGAVAAAALFGVGAIAFHASSFPGLSLCGAAAMGLALPSLWLLLVPSTFMSINAHLEPVHFDPERLNSAHELGVATPRRSSCSVSLCIGAFLLTLVYTTLLALTIALTTYDYLPPELRGLRGQRFHIFYLTASVIGAAVVVLRSPLAPTLQSTTMDRLRRVIGAGMCCVCVIPIASIYTASFAPPGSNSPPLTLGNVASDLRLVSFNAYQGFNRAGGNNFHAIRSMLDDFDPHIVALQESDTMQTGSGSLDLTLYLALHRGMYSFANPATDADSFGCTLLSSFPILAASGIVLPSLGENACFQHVLLNVHGTLLHVMNVHLGNDGTTDRDNQLELVLAYVQNASGPLILMGDFNTRKGSRAYASMVQSTQLRDAGDRGNCVRPSPHPSTGVPIEYIFFRNVTCVQFEYPQRYRQEETADSFPRVAYMNLTSN